MNCSFFRAHDTILTKAIITLEVCTLYFAISVSFNFTKFFQKEYINQINKNIFRITILFAKDSGNGKEHEKVHPFFFNDKKSKFLFYQYNIFSPSFYLEKTVRRHSFSRSLPFFKV